MYFQSHDKGECCGCGACQQICPKQCISMILTEDGFQYPTIDKKICVECEKCFDVCPIHQSRSILLEQQPKHCFYGWHKDNNVRMKSTSGGTFSALSEIIFQEPQSTIFGALYDENWTVRHSGIPTIDGLKQLRQSKYVQSEIGECYNNIKEKLYRNEHVLFCGTPCQVAGLRCFLGKDFTNLLLIDLVCHGVTSPEVFKKYIEFLENREGDRVRNIRFRDKVKIGNISSIAHTTIIFENDKTISSECNLYLRAYMKGIMQRQSCKRCPYATPIRCSDITLGDFWGIEEILPDLKNEFHKGISLILANSKKGLNYCKQLKDNMNIIETNVSYAFNGKNMQLEKPIEIIDDMPNLYDNVLKYGVKYALIKGLGIRFLILMYYRWIIVRIKAYLPKRVYKCIIFFKRSFAK